MRSFLVRGNIGENQRAHSAQTSVLSPTLRSNNRAWCISTAFHAPVLPASSSTFPTMRYSFLSLLVDQISPLSTGPIETTKNVYINYY
jgi:hypothetical protein